jgi:hypothetical protein
MGAAQVIVIDQIPERLELARRFGADHTLSLQELSRPEDRVAAVKELTRGWGADVVCDFVGFPSVIPEGLQMLKSGGTYLEIGHISPGHKFEFHPASIVALADHRGMIQYDPWAISGRSRSRAEPAEVPLHRGHLARLPAGSDQRGLPRGGVAGPPAQPAQDQPRRDRALGEVTAVRPRARPRARDLGGLRCRESASSPG